ncbi:hypothetical protein DIPPA_14589 [Diplonema papillatum]|nr:hypothetical protein DIPPA_14589 [Diplonema papillatum]
MPPKWESGRVRESKAKAEAKAKKAEEAAAKAEANAEITTVEFGRAQFQSFLGTEAGLNFISRKLATNVDHYDEKTVLDGAKESWKITDSEFTDLLKRGKGIREAEKGTPDPRIKTSVDYLKKATKEKGHVVLSRNVLKMLLKKDPTSFGAYVYNGCVLYNNPVSHAAVYPCTNGFHALCMGQHYRVAYKVAEGGGELTEDEYENKVVEGGKKLTADDYAYQHTVRTQLVGFTQPVVHYFAAVNARKHAGNLLELTTKNLCHKKPLGDSKIPDSQAMARLLSKHALDVYFCDPGCDLVIGFIRPDADRRPDRLELHHFAHTDLQEFFPEPEELNELETLVGQLLRAFEGRREKELCKVDYNGGEFTIDENVSSFQDVDRKKFNDTIELLESEPAAEGSCS